MADLVRRRRSDIAGGNVDCGSCDGFCLACGDVSPPTGDDLEPPVGEALKGRGGSCFVLRYSCWRWPKAWWYHKLERKGFHLLAVVWYLYSFVSRDPHTAPSFVKAIPSYVLY